jgi:hypothetical protein
MRQAADLFAAPPMGAAAGAGAPLPSAEAPRPQSSAPFDAEDTFAPAEDKPAPGDPGSLFASPRSSPQAEEPFSLAPSALGAPFGPLVPLARLALVTQQPPPAQPVTAGDPDTAVPNQAPHAAAELKVASKPWPRDRAQRVKEFAWAGAQGVLFLSFLVVAVVLGRGGTAADLIHELRDVLAPTDASTGALAVEEVRVTRRALASTGAGAVVIVTGTVRNGSATPVPGARVEVHFVDAGGDDPRAPPAFGWAWSDIDGVDIDALVDAPAAQALSQRSPRSASLAPGDRASFVVVAPAPAEGARATVTVTAASPPAPAAP